MITSVLAYQVVIALTALVGAAFWGWRGLAAVLGFWLLWTIFMVFTPWLICLQLTVVGIAGAIALPVAVVRNWFRRKRRLRAFESERAMPQAGEAERPS